MLTLAVLVGIAIALTLIAFKSGMVLFRVGAILGWLAIGILAWTSPATIGVSTFPVGAQYVISLICVVMCIAIALMQMGTDIRHEQLVRGKQAGYPGAATASWESWGRPPKKKKMTKNDMSNQRQEEYAQELHTVSMRARKSRIARRRGY
jgi:hypothetical protein